MAVIENTSSSHHQTKNISENNREKSLTIKYGRNFQKPKQGFRLRHYGFDFFQNIDGFKCVPCVCTSDDLQGPEKQEKKNI